MNDVLNAGLFGLSVAGTWTGSARVLRERTTDGVSLVSMMALFLTSGTWIAYGLERGNAVQVLTNVIGVTGALLVLLVGQRTGRLRTTAMVAVTFAYVGLLIASSAAFGLVAVAGIVSAFSVAARLPQAWEAWSRPGGVAVSLSSFCLNGLGSLGWALYGAMRGDVAIVAVSLFVTVQSLFVIVRTAQGRRPSGADQPALDLALSAA